MVKFADYREPTDAEADQLAEMVANIGWHRTIKLLRELAKKHEAKATGIRKGALQAGAGTLDVFCSSWKLCDTDDYTELR